MRMLSVAAALAALVLSVPGNAAELFVYDFTANNSDGYGPSATHHGTFAVLYEGNAFTQLGIDLSIGSTTFTHLNTAMTQGVGDGSPTNPPFLLIGGVSCGPDGMCGGDDFWLYFRRDPADLSILIPFTFAYQDESVDPFGLALGSTGDFSITRVFRDFEVHDPIDLSAVPELSTWAMMLFGFGVLGVAFRRQSRLRSQRPSASPFNPHFEMQAAQADQRSVR